MKKLIVALGLSTLFLFACSNDSKNNENVNKDVEITIPAEFFEGQTEEEIRTAAEEEGVKEVKFNEDGSVNYTMDREQHEEILAEMRTAVDEVISDMTTSGDYPSIKSVTKNDDYTQFDVNVVRTEFEQGYDSFALIGLALAVPIYHMFTGSGEDTKVTFNIVDEATGEVFDTSVYPDDMEE